MRRLITFLAMPTLVLTACSMDPGPSQEVADIEEMIRADVVASTEVETIVRCPEDATVEPHATFECYVSQANGQSGIAVVSIDDTGAPAFEPLPNPP